MKVKEKPCKGTGKAMGYGCGRLQVQRKYGLGYKCGCFSDWLRNSAEGKRTVEKARLHASVKVKKDKAKETREWKEAHKSIAKLKQEARAVFQKWIRARDANRKCVSCGKDSQTWDGSHFYPAELYSGLIFNEMNVHKSCVYCNQHLGGNLSEYRKRLIERFGADEIAELDRLAIETKGKKWERHELNEIKSKYKLKLKNHDFDS